MAQEQIKCKQLSFTRSGNKDPIVFRLEDETIVKVYFEMMRVGIAVERKNPDGTPLYILQHNVRIETVTKDKTFFMPSPPVPTQSTNEKQGDKAFVR